MREAISCEGQIKRLLGQIDSCESLCITSRFDLGLAAQPLRVSTAFFEVSSGMEPPGCAALMITLTIVYYLGKVLLQGKLLSPANCK